MRTKKIVLSQSPTSQTEGPDYIAVKTDEPDQKASTRLQRECPSPRLPPRVTRSARGSIPGRPLFFLLFPLASIFFFSPALWFLPTAATRPAPPSRVPTLASRPRRRLPGSATSPLGGVSPLAFPSGGASRSDFLRRPNPRRPCRLARIAAALVARAGTAAAPAAAATLKEERLGR